MTLHKQLSIVIVNWNTRDLLQLCIDSILNNLSSYNNYEIIIVDNGSTDDSVVMVETLYPEVNLIKNRKNVGFGAAVNKAQLSCNGEYILLFNSDAKFLDDGINDLILILDNDNTIGAITGLMYNEENVLTPAYYSFPKYRQLIKSFTLDIIKKTGKGVRAKDRGISHLINGHKVYDVDWVSGGYMLIRKAAIDGDSIFNENIFMYFEDTLFCRKLWNMGYRVTYSSVAPVIHAQGSSGKKIRKKTVRYSLESSRLYISEAYGEEYLSSYNLILSLSWRISVAILWLLSVLGIKKARDKIELLNYLLAN